jgi:NADP-dependent 3-hydroxy acid dehydrogenase YdfG
VAALARPYAAPGVHPSLLDRDPEGLQSTRRQCEDRGTTAFSHASDVTHRETMVDCVIASDDHRPLGLVIATAGITRGSAACEETEKGVRSAFVRLEWPCTCIAVSENKGMRPGPNRFGLHPVKNRLSSSL